MILMNRPTAINGIFKFPPSLNPFGQETIYVSSPQANRFTQLKNDTFGLVSRLVERNFVNYRKPYG